MDIKEFSKKLDGRQYVGYKQFLQSEIDMAIQNGFVIVYGASDDLMEFEGSIIDEAGCYDGGEVFFNKNGVQGWAENVIEALWCEEKDDKGNVITWTYKTDIPHETFMIYEDDELYCRAIVFNINDLK